MIATTLSAIWSMCRVTTAILPGLKFAIKVQVQCGCKGCHERYGITLDWPSKAAMTIKRRGWRVAPGGRNSRHICCPECAKEKGIE